MRKLITLFLILFSLAIASAQWVAQQSNLPADINIYGISAVNENVVWASGMKNNGGFAPCNWFCRTMDGGANWIAGRISLPANFFICNISAVNTDTAWAAVGLWALSNQAGVYKTTDGGNTWTQQTTAFPYPNTGAAYVHFFDENDGIAVGDPINAADKYWPVFITSDGGTNWQRVPDSNNVERLPGEFASSVNMYCAVGNFFCCGGCYGSSGRVFMSTNRGKTWTASRTEFTTPSSVHVWPAFMDSLNGIVAAGSGMDHLGIAHTNDGGETWHRVFSPEISSIWCASVPGTTGMYMLTGGGTWGSMVGKYPGTAFTLDNGATWTVIDNIAHTTPAFVSRNVGWAGAQNSNLIYKWTISSGRKITAFPASCSFGKYEVGQTSSLNTCNITNYSTSTVTISNVAVPGSNFKLINPPVLPVKLATLQTLALNLQFTPQAAGNLQDSVVILSDASNASRFAIALKGTGVSIAKALPGTMYAASTSLHTINTVTGAATAFASLGRVQIHSLAIRPSTMGLYGVCGSANPAVLYRIDCNTGDLLSVCTIPKSNLWAIAFSPSDSLYGATTSGELYRIDLQTGDAKLVSVSAGFYYAALAFHPLTGQIWASFTNKGDRIYTVDPQTGAVTLIGATGDNVRVLSLTFSASGILYGIKGTGTATNTLISIDTNTAAGTVLASTGTTGLRTIAMSPVTTAVKEMSPEGLLSSYALAHNYPNPFNAQTVIEYQLPQPGQVKLAVYNLLGQEVKTLINKTHAAGRYNLIWDSKDNFGQAVPSGVYFYRIQSEGFTETKKMLLLQ